MEIRKLKIEDAEKFIELKKTLDSETDFLLLSSGERTTTVKEQENLINRFNNTNETIVFVIELDMKLIGFIDGSRSSYKKNKHVLYISLGILKKYNGLGYGKYLLNRIEQWALENDIHRIELTVRTDNKRAIKLYEKCGFDIEGIKQHSLKIENKYFDEFYMSKLLV